MVQHESRIQGQIRTKEQAETMKDKSDPKHGEAEEAQTRWKDTVFRDH